LSGKSLKLLPPDTFPRRKICQKFVCGRGSAPDPVEGAYSAPPDLLAGFKAPTSEGRAVQGGEEKGKEGGGRRKGGWKGERRNGRERVMLVLLFPHFETHGHMYPRGLKRGFHPTQRNERNERN